MHWKVKVAKLAVTGRVPFGAPLRRARRAVFGYAPDPSNLLGALSNLAEMEAELSALGRSFAGASILEIGSGWFPVVPITLALRGAGSVLLTDLNVHMDATTFATTLDFLRRHTAHPRLHGARGIGDFPMRYLAPFRTADVPDASLDYIVSRTVLEHIFPQALGELLVGLRPKLKPGGLMIHYIDHSDHMEHADRSLSRVNFLTWSPKRHDWVNRLTKEGENRLRHHEYQAVFEAAGYRVVRTRTHLHEATRATLGTSCATTCCRRSPGACSTSGRCASSSFRCSRRSASTTATRA